MKKNVFFAAALALLAMTSAAQATLLAPGANTPPDPYDTAVVGNDLTLVATKTGTFSTLLSGAINGSYQESVFRTTAATPFAPAGSLDFVFQINVTGSGEVSRISSGGYTGLTVDAQQGAIPTTVLNAAGFTTGTAPAITADRSTLIADNGDTVGFNFTPPSTNQVTAANTPSYILIFATNATNYTNSTFGISDGHTDNVMGFIPGPEPTSLVLFGGLAFGLGGASLRRWRQQRKAVTA